MSTKSVLRLDLGKDSYDIILERGALLCAGEHIRLDRRVLILTDDGVPRQYSEAVASSCKDPYIFTIPQGEKSKNFESYRAILEKMCREEFTRGDCVVAVGGGVCSDLAGFCAASYMRGIDFYNIPTTTLSQIDASIGGKTAIDFCGYKNIVGAFHQPRAVLIDPDTLLTLPERRISDGLSEAVKMAACFDEELFGLFERYTKEELFGEKIDEIILHSLKIKKSVVEKDERESGLRKALNFGHTLGHALESWEGFSGFYHGECVALGMLAVAGGEVRERLRAVLAKLGLPTECQYDREKIASAVAHDKKLSGDTLSAVYVENIGSFEIRDLPLEKFLIERDLI